MEPIIIYNEASIDGKRTYTLFPDRVLVRGVKNFSAHFEVFIPLDTLNPEFNRIWARTPSFFILAILEAFAIIAFGVLWETLQNPLSTQVVQMLGAFIIAMIPAFAFLYHKIESVQFVNHEGITLLSIARSGPDVKKLDAFIEKLIECIKVSNETNTKS